MGLAHSFCPSENHCNLGPFEAQNIQRSYIAWPHHSKTYLQGLVQCLIIMNI